MWPLGLIVLFAPSPAGGQEIDVAALCVENPQMRPRVSRLWGEVRQALHTWARTADSAGYRYELTLYDRRLAADGRTILEEELQATDRTEPPLSPRGRATLLALENTHCFSLDSQPAASQVALRFEPSAGNVTTDSSTIAGEFRLDRETAQLEATEYTQVVDDRIRGVVEFEKLDRGAWITHRWRVRVPMVDSTANPDGQPAGAGYREFGGGVTAVVDDDGVEVFVDRSVAVLTGTVFDTTQSAPLAGAAVALVGTDQWTETDERGEFSFANPLGGDYNLVFGHPRLDSLGFISAPVPVRLVRGQEVSVSLAVPSLTAILESRCPQGTLAPNRRVLLGVVKDVATGRPVAGAEVIANWQSIPRTLQSFSVDDQQAVGVTDSLGAYAACGIPLDRSIVVHAAYRGRMSEFFRVTYGPNSVQIGSRDRQFIDRPVGRLDMELAPLRSSSTTVRGRVTDAATGNGLEGAQVNVVGTSLSTVTDSQGAFSFLGLPPGTHRLTMARIGYRKIRHEFDLELGAAVELPLGALEMPPGVVELAPIVIQAEAVPIGSRHLALEGFYDRREMGFGHFTTREQFEEWSPSSTTDVLQHMPGIRVTPNPAYGFDGDARRYLIGTRRGGSLSGGECPTLYFIDGMYAGNSGDQMTYIDAILSINMVAAIEVYSGGAQTPARFNRAGANCGAVVFWTR